MAGGGFESAYFAELEQAEAGSFWFRARNRLILWALEKYAPHAVSFLEIGCGTGFVLCGIAAARPDMRLAGSEIFGDGLRFAAKRLPRAELMQMDARSIPYSEEFDAIGAFDVLEHIQEDEIVLREIAKSLKVGGRLLLTVPQHQFLWSDTDVNAHHVRRYSAAELKRKIEGAGLRVLRISSFVSLLLPLMLYSRRRTRPNERAAAELRLNPYLDLFLEQVLRAELFMIRSGLNFPMGGSLLLVAKKHKSREA